MAYRYNYNERSCFEGEDHRDNWDIPSAKAVQDTLVEECDGKIVKSRRQQVAGREYIVCAEFGTRGRAKLSDLMKQATDPCSISSMCTIFAESEIISYLSQKMPVADIAAGTGRSIAKRVLAMGRSAQIP